MKFFSFILLLLVASLTGQVKHPPTIEKCQGDQRLWLSKVKASDDGNADYLPGWDTISQWAGEMEECATADPGNRVAYENVRGGIQAFKFMRQLHFIERHDLYDQFIEEDKAGKR